MHQSASMGKDDGLFPLSEPKYKHFHLRKCIHKCFLWYVGHFVQASMCFMRCDCHIASLIMVNIGLSNGLLPDGPKPLPEPILAYHQGDLVAFIRGQQFSWILKISIPKVCLKFIHLKSQSYLSGVSVLTHLPLDKLAAISQTIFSDAFLLMKSFVFWL